MANKNYTALVIAIALGLLIIAVGLFTPLVKGLHGQTVEEIQAKMEEENNKRRQWESEQTERNERERKAAQDALNRLVTLVPENEKACLAGDFIKCDDAILGLGRMKSQLLIGSVEFEKRDAQLQAARETCVEKVENMRADRDLFLKLILRCLPLHKKYVQLCDSKTEPNAELKALGCDVIRQLRKNGMSADYAVQTAESKKIPATFTAKKISGDGLSHLYLSKANPADRVALVVNGDQVTKEWPIEKYPIHSNVYNQIVVRNLDSGKYYTVEVQPPPGGTERLRYINEKLESDPGQIGIFEFWTDQPPDDFRIRIGEQAVTGGYLYGRSLSVKPDTDLEMTIENIRTKQVIVKKIIKIPVRRTLFVMFKNGKLSEELH